MSYSDPWGQPPKPKYTPANPRDLAVLFEAVLRAVGGGVELGEGRPIGLSGKLVVDHPKPGVIRVRTLDLAEGRWNPAQAVPVIEEGEEARYANSLAEHGIEIIEEAIVALTWDYRVSDTLRKIVDKEMNRILDKAREIAASKKYVQDIEREEQEDAKRHAAQTAQPLTPNPGQRRRLPRG